MSAMEDDDREGTKVGEHAPPARALSTGRALVPVPTPEPEPEERPEPRLSDVDEWGRSEHMRELARKLYDPVYRNWFRVEWEGLEKIPTDGGALLVANHAAAIPSDAPAIMHGIETELDRPVYGLADNIFRTLPVIGTLWSRLGGVPAHPDNAYRLLREQKQLVLVFPEGVQGPRQDSTTSATSCAASAGAASSRSPCAPACRSSPSRWSAPRSRCRPCVRIPSRWPGCSASPTSPSPPTCSPSGPLGIGRLLPGQVQAAGARPGPLRRAARPGPLLASRIMDESEAIRDRIQDALYDMLPQRGESVWFG